MRFIIFSYCDGQRVLHIRRREGVLRIDRAVAERVVLNFFGVEEVGVEIIEGRGVGETPRAACGFASD